MGVLHSNLYTIPLICCKVYNIINNQTFNNCFFIKYLNAMIQHITKKDNYLINPVLQTDNKMYNTEIKLNNKTWLINNDYWMKHVHIKMTNMCNAKCPFCIEQFAENKENFTHLYDNLYKLLKELSEQGHLTTVSITGGEPTLFPYNLRIIIKMVKRFKPNFFTINTNGFDILPELGKFNWIDISRHKIGYDSNCKLNSLNFKDIKYFKQKHPNTKIRIQCVLYNNGLKTIQEFDEFVDYYKEIADDISIRRLITTTNNPIQPNDLYTTLKQHMFNNAEFIEQVLKDYYCYESWKYKGITINFSHSNMALLDGIEHTEPDNLLREIVVHPDGVVSGSWYKNKKIIFE